MDETEATVKSSMKSIQTVRLAEFPSAPYIGNAKCDVGEYNTVECGWDGGDCKEFNEKYPNCKLEFPSAYSYIGNTKCDGGE